MKHTFTLIFLGLYSIVSAQNSIKEYVTNNTHKIENLDTNSFTFDDLEPIGNAIGNARVVMLGEQSHGDAATFLAKTRLIRYLHEKKRI